MSKVERIKIADRASWLEMRKQDITASGAAALLGVHPYTTALALWAEKTGAIPQDEEVTEAMDRGIELEPLAIRRLAKIQPTWKLRRPNTYYRDPVVRLGATPDCFANDPERKGFGVVQVKSVEPRIFRKGWRSSEGGTVEPPLWIVVQTIIEAHLTGASWGAVAALVIGFGIDLHVVEVPLHAGVIDRIKAETEAFWRLIASGKRPDPEYARDGALIARLFDDPTDVEVDLLNDNRIPTLVAEDAAIGELLSVNGKRRKEIRAEILNKIGNASSARIATGVISAKLVNRKGYEVAPTSYRDIRFRASA